MNTIRVWLLAGGILTGLMSGFAPADEPRVPLRIDAGGKGGDGWVSDEGFVRGGAPFAFRGRHDVAGVKDPAPGKVYETVRHQGHQYRVRLPKGKYRLRFHFTDGFDSRDRKMDYVVEGLRVITGYSPVDAGGGVNRVSVVEVVTEVKDEALEIECRAGEGNDVFEAGIEILAAGAGDEVTRGPVVAPRREAPEAGRTAAEVSQEIRGMAGAPVRLVWLQGKDAEHYTTSKSVVKLMVLDTEDGKGARDLLGEEGPYSKPMITPDGGGIVFSDRRKKEMRYVVWTGGEVRNLGDGFAADVWEDPATGTVWVYGRKGGGKKEDAIVRCKLDDPEKREAIWDRTQNGHDGVPWFQLSADGLRFSDAFPWSKCGVGELKKPGAEGKNWDQYGGGCWPAMAPDNSYRFWHFNGSHTDLTFFEPGAKGKRTVSLNGMAGLGRQKVYHPRWSNDVRFVTVTGPERSKHSQLYLGRFNAGFTQMEDWVQVTNNDRADIFGDAWIAPEGSAVAAEVPDPNGGEVPGPVNLERWPGSEEGLVFLWESSEEKNEIALGGGKFATCDLTLRGSAVPTRDFGMDLSGGWAEADAGRAAFILERCQGAGAFSVEALVTPGNVSQGGPARIVSLSNGTLERNFTLGQEGAALVFRMRAGGADGNGVEYSPGEVQAGMARHVLVSFAAGRLDFYLDGKLAGSEEVGGDLSAWKVMPLVFGDEVGGGRGWDGRLEAIAIRARGVESEEAEELAKSSWARLARRGIPEWARVEAELVAISEAPTLEDMGTYRRALVENVYDVKEVLSGQVPERIVVSEWVILDREPVVEQKEVGKVYGMDLEAVEAHPELKEEFTNVGHSEFAAPKFYRVRR